MKSDGITGLPSLAAILCRRSTCLVEQALLHLGSIGAGQLAQGVNHALAEHMHQGKMGIGGVGYGHGAGNGLVAGRGKISGSENLA
jgi:hypothetical protein